ncbi:MAG: amidohydrolase [Bacteroidetes bacterium CHB5]|nr:amidohydrolase [Bacteroidetes bacterium CHB5]
MRIDSHQHFWIYNRARDGWITDAMQELQRDFLPASLKPLLQEHAIEGCVAVQADPSEAETEFLISQANEFEFIKGVVGWVNLTDSYLEARLAHYKSYPVVKGFRHIVQAEPAGYMVNPVFIQGIKHLNKFDFTYDILIKEHQLKETLEFIKQLPAQKLVIDHIAKPVIGNTLSQWKKYITAIAQHEQVYCKLSGMVTEANWHSWKPENFTPYLDIVLNVFGSNRVMYGSDWPVCLLAAQYAQQLKIVEDYIQSFSDSEKQAIMGENATRFYNL